MTREQRQRREAYFEGIATALQVINKADGVLGAWREVLHECGPLYEIAAAAKRLDIIEESGLRDHARMMGQVLGDENLPEPGRA